MSTDLSENEHRKYRCCWKSVFARKWWNNLPEIEGKCKTLQSIYVKSYEWRDWMGSFCRCRCCRGKIVERWEKNWDNGGISALDCIGSWTIRILCRSIFAIGDVEISLLLELHQRIQDGKGNPADRPSSVVIPISKAKWNIMNCGMHWVQNC